MLSSPLPCVLCMTWDYITFLIILKFLSTTKIVSSLFYGFFEAKILCNILTKETLSFIIAPNMMNFAQTHQFPTEQTSNWASYCSLSLLQTYSANSNALQNNEMFIERLSTQYSRISYHDKNHRKHIIFGNSSIFEWNTVTQL